MLPSLTFSEPTKGFFFLENSAIIPFMAKKALILGITGQDWIAEHEAGDGRTGVLTTIADLIYAKQSFGKVRWVLAVPVCARPLVWPRKA